MPEDMLSRPTEASLVTLRLRDDLVRGTIAPGAKLKLLDLAERYAVSRGPLREAVSRLAAEGLVTIEDQRGFRATEVSRSDLLDVTRTRQRIETMALRDAIEHGDPAWEGRVMAACHVLERVSGADLSCGERFAQHHQHFHEVLVEACPSAYLRSFRQRLYALTERYRNLAAGAYAAGRADRNVSAEHRAIAGAAIARRADEACALLHEHLQETTNTLVAVYPELFEGRT